MIIARAVAEGTKGGTGVRGEAAGPPPDPGPSRGPDPSPGFPTASAALLVGLATPGHTPAPSVHRRPAPRVLRAADVFLGVLLLGALTGLLVGQLRPSSLAPLRVLGRPAATAISTAPAARTRAAAPPAPAPVPRVAPVAVPPRPPSLQLLSATPATAVFRVPVAAYSVAVEVTQPCWIRLQSLGTPATALEATLVPTSSPNRFSVHGSTSLMVAARAEAIRISSNGRLLGEIDAPVVGLTYEFLPPG